jgi:hypothetical protein
VSVPIAGSGAMAASGESTLRISKPLYRAIQVVMPECELYKHISFRDRHRRLLVRWALSRQSRSDDNHLTWFYRPA